MIAISLSTPEPPCGVCCGNGACIDGKCQCVPGYDPATNCTALQCRPSLDSSLICSNFGVTYPTISYPSGDSFCLPHTPTCDNTTCHPVEFELNYSAMVLWGFLSQSPVPSEEELFFQIGNALDTKSVRCKSLLAFICQTIFPRCASIVQLSDPFRCDSNGIVGTKCECVKCSF